MSMALVTMTKKTRLANITITCVPREDFVSIKMKKMGSDFGSWMGGKLMKLCKH